MEKLLIIDSSSFVVCSNIARVEYIDASTIHNWNGEKRVPAGMRVFETNGESFLVPCSKEKYIGFQNFMPTDTSVFKI